MCIRDRPVSSLDISTRAQILGLIKSFQLEQNLSVLLITHDLAVVRSIADKVSVMYLGNLVETGDAREVINNPMHPYSKALVSAIPLPDPNRVRVDSSTMLKDEPPSPIHLPSGCPFHPRCPAATEKCSQNKPVWKQLSPNPVSYTHLDVYKRQILCDELPIVWLEEQGLVAAYNAKFHNLHSWSAYSYYIFWDVWSDDGEVLAEEPVDTSAATAPADTTDPAQTAPAKEMCIRDRSIPAWTNSLYMRGSFSMMWPKCLNCRWVNWAWPQAIPPAGSCWGISTWE